MSGVYERLPPWIRRAPKRGCVNAWMLYVNEAWWFLSEAAINHNIAASTLAKRLYKYLDIYQHEPEVVATVTAEQLCAYATIKIGQRKVESPITGKHSASRATGRSDHFGIGQAAWPAGIVQIWLSKIL